MRMFETLGFGMRRGSTKAIATVVGQEIGCEAIAAVTPTLRREQMLLNGCWHVDFDAATRESASNSLHARLDEVPVEPEHFSRRAMQIGASRFLTWTRNTPHPSPEARCNFAPWPRRKMQIRTLAKKQKRAPPAF